MNASRLQLLIWADKMTIEKLTIIDGGRNDLEAAFARALFGVDDAEITRLSKLLDSIQAKQPKLVVVKNTDCKSTNA